MNVTCDAKQLCVLKGRARYSHEELCRLTIKELALRDAIRKAGADKVLQGEPHAPLALCCEPPGRKGTRGREETHAAKITRVPVRGVNSALYTSNRAPLLT